ncbi:MAG: hypothetical protein CMF51_02880 [Legionellales bacterium]|nr:hypothetical protein [Legionellales bacterium]
MNRAQRILSILTAILMLFMSLMSLTLRTDQGITLVAKILIKIKRLPIKVERIQHIGPDTLSIRNIQSTNLRFFIPETTLQLHPVRDWLQKPVVQSIHIRSIDFKPIAQTMIVLHHLSAVIQNNEDYILSLNSPNLKLKGHGTWSFHRHQLNFNLLHQQHDHLIIHLNHQTATSWQLDLHTQHWPFAYQPMNMFGWIQGHCTIDQIASLQSLKCSPMTGQLNGYSEHFNSLLMLQYTDHLKTLKFNFHMGGMHGIIDLKHNLKPIVTWDISIPNLKHLVPIWSGQVISQGTGALPSKSWILNTTTQLKKLKTSVLNAAHILLSLKATHHQHHIALNTTSLELFGLMLRPIHIDLYCPKNKPFCSYQPTTEHTVNSTLIPSSHLLYSELSSKWLKQFTPYHSIPNLIESDRTHQYCFQLATGSICFHLDLNTQRFILMGQLKHMVLDHIAAWLPNHIFMPYGGDLNGHWFLSKSLNHPWRGEAKLSLMQAKALIPYTLDSVHNIQGQLNFNSQRTPALSFELKGQPHQGTIDLKGQLMHQDHQQDQLTLTGTHVSIYHSNFMHLIGNPHIQLKSLFDQPQLNGRVTIHHASFSKHWQSMPKLPEHTLILGTHQSNTHFQPTGTIELTTPKPIPSNLFNLKGQLFGQLKLFMRPQNPTTAQGFVKLIQPSFNNIPEIKIHEAQLRFSDHVITHPQIFVKLDRTLNPEWDMSADPFSLQPIRVGMRLYGSISHPQYQYFSEPIHMSDNQILTSLISGQQDGLLSPSQLALFSIGQFDPLLSNSNHLRFIPMIDHIKLSSRNSLDSEINNPLLDTVITLSKQLTPNMDLQYQFGLLDNHYQISSQLRLNQNTMSQLYLNEKSYGINLFKSWKIGH